MSQMPPSMPPPPQAGTDPILPYATPMAHQGQGAWREGDKLVVTKQVQLPDRCVKCNAPADGAPWTKTLYWHNPALYILIAFPGLLIYAIVAICVRQRARVTASLCANHRKARARRVMITWAIAAGGLITAIVGFTMVGDRQTETVGLICILVGMLVLIVAGVLGILFSAVLAPAKMEGNYAWLKGAGNDYLANFPPTGR